MLRLLLYLAMLQQKEEFANHLIRYLGKHTRLTIQIKAFGFSQRRYELIFRGKVIIK